MPRGVVNTRKLWMRVCAELGAATLRERYIQSTERGEAIEGLCEDEEISVNPMHNTVDTVIHELLHKMFPHRSERSVLRTTTQIMKTLTDDEVQLFYAEYKRRRQLADPKITEL